MPSEATVHAALHDIRDNIVLARQFVENLTFDAFAASRLHVYATTRALEIISEAARRLPKDMLTRYPDLPWRSIMDAGNLYRHEYDDVAESAVWRTVQGSLAPLFAVVLREIEALGPSP